MNYLTILLIISLPILYFIKKSIGRKLSLADFATIVFTNILNLIILSLAVFIILTYSTDLKQEQNLFVSFFVALFILIVSLVFVLSFRHNSLPKKEMAEVIKSEITQRRLNKGFFNPFKNLYDVIFFSILIALVLSSIHTPILLSLFLAVILALIIAPESCNDKSGVDCYSRFNIFRTLRDRLMNPSSHTGLREKSFLKNVKDGVKIIKNIGTKRLSKRKKREKKADTSSLKTTLKKETTQSPKKVELDADALFQKALEQEPNTSLALLYKLLLSSSGNYLLQVKIYRAIAIILENKEEYDNALFCYNKAMEISVKFLEKKHPTARYKIACEELERLGLEKETYYTK